MTFPVFDLDVEIMSRDEIIKNYFDAVAAYEELKPCDDDIMELRRFFGLQQRQGEVLSLLMTGRLVQFEQIGHISHNTDNPRNLANVQISKIRKILAPYSVRIETLRNSGYQMPQSSIRTIKSLIPNLGGK